MPQPEKQLFINHITEETKTRFREMCFHYGRSPAKMIEFLVDTHKEGRLFILDAPTRDVLVGAAKEDILRAARMAAREEVRLLLFEKGFISDPHDR